MDLKLEDLDNTNTKHGVSIYNTNPQLKNKGIIVHNTLKTSALKSTLSSTRRYSIEDNFKNEKKINNKKKSNTPTFRDSSHSFDYKNNKHLINKINKNKSLYSSKNSSLHITNRSISREIKNISIIDNPNNYKEQEAFPRITVNFRYELCSPEEFTILENVKIFFKLD